MHDDLKPFKQNPSQKLHIKLHQFWKTPKKFQKPKKLGPKIWNAWLMSEKASYQRRKKILRLKTKWGWGLKRVREVLGGEKLDSVERGQGEMNLVSWGSYL